MFHGLGPANVNCSQQQPDKVLDGPFFAGAAGRGSRPQLKTAACWLDVRRIQACADQAVPAPKFQFRVMCG